MTPQQILFEEIWLTLRHVRVIIMPVEALFSQLYIESYSRFLVEKSLLVQDVQYLHVDTFLISKWD